MCLTGRFMACWIEDDKEEGERKKVGTGPPSPATLMKTGDMSLYLLLVAVLVNISGKTHTTAEYIYIYSS
jgi:hypothetical protein